MIVALDLETTGLDPQNDKIIEVALVKFHPDTFEIIDTYSTLINPGIHIPELNSTITNIFDTDVEDAPSWEQVYPTVSQFIGDCPILGHNVYFDIDFLKAYNIDVSDHEIIDTFMLSNVLMLYEKSLSLEHLCKVLQIELTDAHRALSDTIASVRLYEALVCKIHNLQTPIQEIIGYIFSRSDDLGLQYIYRTFFTKTTLHHGEWIQKVFDNIPVKSAAHEKHTGEVQEAPEAFESLIGSFPGYSVRQNQTKMSDMVSTMFTSKQKYIIEAPTGIGKTFAYLIPSIIHAYTTGEQVYISTSTKALQDQLYFKDLSFLAQHLPYPFSYSKLKGRKNYIGIHEFFSFTKDGHIYSRHEAVFIAKVSYWLTQTLHGELSELDYYGQEFSFLGDIHADTLSTNSKENTYLSKEFFVHARKDAKTSDIVVVNNAILFQDISQDGAILGEVKNLVFDEAHNLEDVVTQALKKSIGISEVDKSGHKILQLLEKYPHERDQVEHILNTIDLQIGLIEGSVRSYILQKTPSESKYRHVLIGDDFFTPQYLDYDVSIVRKTLDASIIDIIDILGKFDDVLYLQFSRYLRVYERLRELYSVCLDPLSKETFIVTARMQEEDIFLEMSYLHPGKYLETHLWNDLDTCLLTSATLQINESFDYIKGLLSLEDFSGEVISSEFDYSKQALLYLPDDLGNIKYNFKQVVAFLDDFISVVRGRCMVLFTSFNSIRETFTSLGPTMKKKGINLYAQSIGGGKHKFIESFKDYADTSVLIGTDTLWEGIDIPGGDLQYLVVHKIPFMVPTDPYFQARSKLFKDSFLEYSIPKSIIKLQQGFGRLIRTKTDTGIIIFLDDRIHTAEWGKMYTHSFPKGIKVRRGAAAEIVRLLGETQKNSL